MKTQRLSLIGTLCSLFVITFSIPVLGTSVYTIDHSAYDGGPCTLNAFNIVNDQFVYRDSVELPEHGWGGIDVAIDELTNTLFVSFEDTGRIEVVDTQDLDSHSYITIQGTNDITALLFDKENRRLLATDRNTNFLHIIKWDVANKTLSLEETSRLDNITYATDLALHENILYVSEFLYSSLYYTHVKMYDMNDGFSYIGEIDTDEDLVSIDYNETDDFLYGGGLWSTQNLSKFADPNTITKDVGTRVYGVATDDTTAGRVFFTALDSSNNWTIEMWDTAIQLTTGKNIFQFFPSNSTSPGSLNSPTFPKKIITTPDREITIPVISINLPKF